MHVLVVGNGGREHALAWKISQSPLVSRLSMTPAGNPAMTTLGMTIDMAVEHIPAWAFAQKVDLVVVGPEAPLARGLANALELNNIPCFGPTREAAQLETSKGFTRRLCEEVGIPAPKFGEFSDRQEALGFLRTLPAPYVIKADGLAAGKGVIIAPDLATADKAVTAMLSGQFGEAGKTFIIEEFLQGTEMSFFALTDGTSAIACGTAQDHKRAFDGDKGPNTGGMGGFSPSPLETPDLTDAIMSKIIQPTVDAMRERAMPYRGVLYAGLFITDEGPKIIEYNCRFGDPECQMLMRRIDGDIVPSLLAAATSGLAEQTLSLSAQKVANIVYATKGYPGRVEKGSVITGLEKARGAHPGIEIFHAGTREENGALTAHGGRVLSITASGASYKDALDHAYDGIAQISWPEGFYRSDIGRSLRASATP